MLIKKPKHRKGQSAPREVACQIVWNSIPPYIDGLHTREYTSPFFFFKHETAMKKWQKEARKLYPTIKFRMHMANWTPDTAMHNLLSREPERAGKHAAD